MKSRPKICLLLTILLILFISSRNASANTEVRESINSSLTSCSPLYTYTESIHRVRILIGGIWWNLVYDSGKIIDAYPE